MTNLSLAHIERHIYDFTALSQRSGYHGGLSLNAHAALMCEPYETVLQVLDDLAKAKIANPFGCAITMCPIWYIKGISRDWDSYGGNSYGISRDGGKPMLEYTTVYNEAKQLAETFPGKAFVNSGPPTVAELVKVRNKLGLPVVLVRQDDRECMLCNHVADQPMQQHDPAPIEEDFEDEEPDARDYGDFDDRLDPQEGGF